MSMTRVSLEIPAVSVPNIRGVLFDYGNTLVRIRDGSSVLAESLADIGHVVDSSSASKGMQALKDHWHECYSTFPRGQRWTDDIRLDCYRTALSAIGFDKELDGIAREIDLRWASRENGGLYEDVKPTLKALDQMDLSLGVLSQTKRTGSRLIEELESLQLSRFFSVVLTSEDLGYDKPDPKFFDEGSRVIGLKSAELLYVGNRYHEDVVGARDAGLTPVLVERRPRRKTRDCILVTTLLSLPAILERC